MSKHNIPTIIDIKMKTIPNIIMSAATGFFLRTQERVIVVQATEVLLKVLKPMTG